MKFYTIILALLIGGCAKNSRDIVEDGRPIGSFEPKRDYVVDIPMGESQVMGQASGLEILGFITIGASETADGADITGRGDSTLGYGGGSSGGGSAASMALAPLAAISGPLVSLAGGSAGKFKKAALRDACDKANCDVLGYSLYNVNEKNYFLWKSFDVKVKGFPGRVGKLENVQRSYNVGNSYWRRPLPQTR